MEHTLVPSAGTHISQASIDLCHEAVINNNPTTMIFNDIKVTANPGDTPDEIEARWSVAMDEAVEAHRKSPEYAAQQEKRATEIEAGRILVAKLMLQLETLNFNDYDAVLDWVYEVASPSDDTGIGVPAAEIISVFFLHGYKPGINVGKDYDGTDRENVARYIIGQALSGLQFIGAIHPVCTTFIDRYRNDHPRIVNR